jgi:hypothetical protein
MNETKHITLGNLYRVMETLPAEHPHFYVYDTGRIGFVDNRSNYLKRFETPEEFVARYEDTPEFKRKSKIEDRISLQRLMKFLKITYQEVCLEEYEEETEYGWEEEGIYFVGETHKMYIYGGYYDDIAREYITLNALNECMRHSGV